MSTVLQNLNHDLAELVENVRRSLVVIHNGYGGHGAGMIWHPDGLIVTNAHVLHSTTAQVDLPDGRMLPARVLAYDREHDLAAMAVEAHGLPAIALGDSRMLKPGQWVLAVGHPWGVVGAATAGAVIAVGVPPELAGLGRELIQLGLHLRPGHSGGPLVDDQGRLVGINTMIAGPDVGLAVPVHVVKTFLRQALGSQRERAVA